MNTVWKVALLATDVQEVEVPAGAEFLCALEQFEQICVWFRCDPSKPVEKRTIFIVGTGHPAPGNEGRYLGTASLSGRRLMFHVFERVNAQFGVGA
jgi:hypothetical protein